MSTQLFLRSTSFPETNMHAKGLENDPGWSTPAYDLYSQGSGWLSTSRGGSASQFFWAGLTPTGPLPASKYWGALDSFMTYPVTSDFTLSGTVTFNIRAGIDADGNFGLRAYVYRYRAADGTLTAIVNGSNKGTELTTSEVANNWTASPTSTALQKGDCLILMLAGYEQGGNFVSGLSPRIWINGPTGGASGDSYVTFTEDFTMAAPTLGGSKLYLSDVAFTDFSDTGYTVKQLLLDTRDDGQVAAVLEGTGLTNNTDWTITAGGNKIEWITQPLGPVTLEGGLKVQFNGSMAGLPGTVVCSQAQLHRLDADGSNPLLIAKFVPTRGTGSSRQMEWADQNFDTFYEATVAMPNVSLVNHRLRLRVVAVEGYAYPSAKPIGGGSGNDINFKYGATSGGAVGDAFVELDKAVSVYTAPGPVLQQYVVPQAVVV